MLIFSYGIFMIEPAAGVLGFHSVPHGWEDIFPTNQPRPTASLPPTEKGAALLVQSSASGFVTVSSAKRGGSSRLVTLKVCMCRGGGQQACHPQGVCAEGVGWGMSGSLGLKNGTAHCWMYETEVGYTLPPPSLYKVRLDQPSAEAVWFTSAPAYQAGRLPNAKVLAALNLHNKPPLQRAVNAALVFKGQLDKDDQVRALRLWTVCVACMFSFAGLTTPHACPIGTPGG